MLSIDSQPSVQDTMSFLSMPQTFISVCLVMHLFHVPLSEYNPAYQTLHFSDASLMHLQSSSVYSDTLHIRLHMLCNSTPPPASVPPHMLPLLVCLFVYLCHWHTCCLFCLFVSPSGLVPLILIYVQWTRAKSDSTLT